MLFTVKLEIETSRKLNLKPFEILTSYYGGLWMQGMKSCCINWCVTPSVVQVSF